MKSIRYYKVYSRSKSTASENPILRIHSKLGDCSAGKVLHTQHEDLSSESQHLQRKIGHGGAYLQCSARC